MLGWVDGLTAWSVASGTRTTGTAVLPLVPRANAGSTPTTRMRTSTASTANWKSGPGAFSGALTRAGITAVAPPPPVPVELPAPSPPAADPLRRAGSKATGVPSRAAAYACGSVATSATDWLPDPAVALSCVVAR